MNIFYLDPENILGAVGTFSEEESKHIIQVLRYAAGEKLTAVDGKGGYYKGKLEIPQKKQATLRIESKEVKNPPKPAITVFCGLLKNRQRLEWMVEKLVETGVKDIVMLHTFRSERSKVRIDRLESVAISAMKQSKRAHLPKITLCDLESISSKDFAEMQFFIAHEKKQKDSVLFFGNSDLKTKEIVDYGILIGPEGGFTEEEIEIAQNTLNAKPLYLGEIRLRTETAAIVSTALLRGTFNFGW